MGHLAGWLSRRRVGLPNTIALPYTAIYELDYGCFTMTMSDPALGAPNKLQSA